MSQVSRTIVIMICGSVRNPWSCMSAMSSVSLPRVMRMGQSRCEPVPSMPTMTGRGCGLTVLTRLSRSRTACGFMPAWSPLAVKTSC